MTEKRWCSLNIIYGGHTFFVSLQKAFWLNNGYLEWLCIHGWWELLCVVDLQEKRGSDCGRIMYQVLLLFLSKTKNLLERLVYLEDIYMDRQNCRWTSVLWVNTDNPDQENIKLSLPGRHAGIMGHEIGRAREALSFSLNRVPCVRVWKVQATNVRWTERCWETVCFEFSRLCGRVYKIQATDVRWTERCWETVFVSSFQGFEVFSIIHLYFRLYSHVLYCFFFNQGCRSCECRCFGHKNCRWSAEENSFLQFKTSQVGNKNWVFILFFLRMQLQILTPLYNENFTLTCNT